MTVLDSEVYKKNSEFKTSFKRFVHLAGICYTYKHIGIANTSNKDENDFLRNVAAQVFIKRVVL